MYDIRESARGRERPARPQDTGEEFTEGLFGLGLEGCIGVLQRTKGSQDVLSDCKEIWTYRNVIECSDQLGRPEQRLQKMGRKD